MKIVNSFAADDLALCRAHSAIVATPKRPAAPVVERRRAPVHAMCLAMSEVFQWVAPVAEVSQTPPHGQQFGRALRSDSHSRSHFIYHDHRVATGPTIMELIKRGHLAAPSSQSLHLVLVAIDKNAYDTRSQSIGWVTSAPYESEAAARSMMEMAAKRGLDYRLCDKDGWIQADGHGEVRIPGDLIVLTKQVRTVRDGQPYTSLYWRPAARAESSVVSTS